MSHENPLTLAALLRREPGLTQRQIVSRLGWNQRDVSRVLSELEVRSSGKAYSPSNPLRYSIRLPAEKRKALSHA